MRRTLLATTFLTLAAVVAHAQQTTITPGQGTITDAQGNVWQISADGSVEENGNWIPGGGGTAALTISTSGTAYGQDNGHDGNTVNSGGWFALSGGQYWTAAAAPAGVTTATTAAATPPTTSDTSATSTTGTAAPASTPTSVNAAGPATSTCAPLAGGAATGSFTAANGQILDPSGKVFIARGINVGPNTMGAASPQVLQSLFPGTNFVRFATGYQSTTMAAEEAYATSLTQAGIVIEIEDHPYPSPGVYSGAQLQAETAWYAQWASDFKNNPAVWFGTMNEPSGGSPAGIEPQEQAIYQAIRGTGSNAILMLELYGGGNPGTIGIPGGMTEAPINTMSNVAWDLHFYGWAVNYSTDQTTVNAALASNIQQAQTITGAGGATIPVIIGEFGNSTDGSTMDPDGSQVVTAVQSSGNGYAAWTFGGSGGDIDNLVSGGGLTDYGQQVAGGIALIQGAAASGGLLHAQRQHRSRRPPQDQPPRLPQVNQRLSISKLLPQPINQQPLNRQQRRRRRQTHKSLRLINLLQIRSPKRTQSSKRPKRTCRPRRLNNEGAHHVRRHRHHHGGGCLDRPGKPPVRLDGRLVVLLPDAVGHVVALCPPAEDGRLNARIPDRQRDHRSAADRSVGNRCPYCPSAQPAAASGATPGGGVRPIEGGVTSNYGNARVLADKECLQRYPGPSGVVIGELRAGKAGTAPLVIDPCATGAGHGMLIAGTRAGKTTSGVTALLHWPTSAIGLDPSAEMGGMLEDALRRKGKTVHLLNPEIPGSGFNALAWIDITKPLAAMQVKEVISWVFPDDKRNIKNDGYFEPTGKALCTAILAHLLWSDRSAAEKTLRTFRKLVVTPEFADAGPACGHPCRVKKSDGARHCRHADEDNAQAILRRVWTGDPRHGMAVGT